MIYVYWVKFPRGFPPDEGMDVRPWRLLCVFQVVACVTSWQLVQMSTADCGRGIVCDVGTSTVRRPTPELGCRHRERERERQTENIVKREVVLYGTVFIPGRQLLHGHPGLWISEYQFEFLLWCVHYYIDNERTNWQMTHKKLDNTMHSPTFNYIKIIIIMWRSLV